MNSFKEIVEDIFGPYPKEIALISDEILPGYLQKPHIAQIAQSKLLGLTATFTSGLTDSHHQSIYPVGYETPQMSGKTWFERSLPNKESAGLGYEFVMLTNQASEFAVKVLSWITAQQLRMDCDFAHHLRYSGLVTSGPYGGPYVPEGIKETFYIALKPWKLFQKEFEIKNGLFHFVIITNLTADDLKVADKILDDKKFYQQLQLADFDFLVNPQKKSFL